MSKKFVMGRYFVSRKPIVSRKELLDRQRDINLQICANKKNIDYLLSTQHLSVFYFQKDNGETRTYRRTSTDMKQIHWTVKNLEQQNVHLKRELEILMSIQL